MIDPLMVFIPMILSWLILMVDLPIIYPDWIPMFYLNDIDGINGYFTDGWLFNGVYMMIESRMIYHYNWSNGSTCWFSDGLPL
jgi:hypothetical protein